MKNLIKLIETLKSQRHMTLSATFPHMLPLANQVPLTLLQSIYGYENDRYIINRGDRLIALISIHFSVCNFPKIKNGFLIKNPYFVCFAFTKGIVLFSSFGYKGNIRKDNIEKIYLECFPVYIDEINGFGGTGGIHCRKIKPISVEDYDWLYKNKHTSSDFQTGSDYKEVYLFLTKYFKLKED